MTDEHRLEVELDEAGDAAGWDQHHALALEELRNLATREADAPRAFILITAQDGPNGGASVKVLSGVPVSASEVFVELSREALAHYPGYEA